jgi:predicted nucleic acid-binding protein
MTSCADKETHGATEVRVYLDANVFIYAIEGHAEIADVLRQLFELFRARKAAGVTSELTLAEVLPKAADIERRNYPNLTVGSRIFDLEPVSREILIETAEYRKHAGMPRLPDAIHVVTAIRAGCETVLSADSRLRLPDGFAVVAPIRKNLVRLIGDLS